MTLIISSFVDSYGAKLIESTLKTVIFRLSFKVFVSFRKTYWKQSHMSGTLYNDSYECQ